MERDLEPLKVPSWSRANPPSGGGGVMDFNRFCDIQNSFSETTVYLHYMNVVNIRVLTFFKYILTM